MKKHLKNIFVVLFLSTGLSGVHAASSIVPKPVRYETTSAEFELNAETRILYGSNAQRSVAELTALALRPVTGFALPVAKATDASSKENAILFVASTDTALGGEGYTLDVTAQHIRVAARSSRGLFYGFQTLRQLFPTDVFSEEQQSASWSVEGCSIKDKPSFKWRGMMLDVSRYWFNKEFVLRYLDIMAAHKMNVLHWHLIDDAGWRIEIKAYPKLTEIGAFRGEGEHRYGGFYTQEEIREVVRYAKARGISIVPEVEIPAHTLAAVVAYPELSCTGKQHQMPTRHSISPELYCAGKDSTWTFLKTVFDEVCDLFPSTYVHIGGDEARYDRWKACPHCQATMKKQGLKTEKELQGWMTSEVEKYLAKKGKRILGWDEILECGVSNKAGIMTWHRLNTAVEGAHRGNPVVMALTGHAYFDVVESKHPGEPPGASWIPPISLKKAYEWHPVPEGLEGAAALNILGGNGCVWTDMFLHKPEILADPVGEGTSHSEAYVEYLSLPRMAALAEVTWTPREKRDWQDFSLRMSSMYARYSKAGWNYRLPIPELTETRQGNGRTLVSTTSPVDGGNIYYTTDDSEPSITSLKYEGPVEVDDPAMFRAIAIAPGGVPTSLSTLSPSAVPHHLKKHGEKIGSWKSGSIAARQPREAIFEATGKIDQNGTYLITFVYTGGTQRLDIHGVEVVRNDTVLCGKDEHHGFTGGSAEGNTYRIQVDNYQTGASFKVKAAIFGDTGDDSNGFVFIRREP